MLEEVVSYAAAWSAIEFDLYPANHETGVALLGSASSGHPWGLERLVALVSAGTSSYVEPY